MEHIARYVIAEIDEGEFNPNYIPDPKINYQVRKAARAILRDGDKIALLFVATDNYHKLPGGGIEEGETVEEALKREIVEEVGCQSKVDDAGAMTIEYRDQRNTLQISYIFMGEVVGDLSEPAFTPGEVADGFKLEWVPIDQVFEVLAADHPQSYGGKFISFRDKLVLEYFKEKLV